MLSEGGKDLLLVCVWDATGLARKDELSSRPEEVEVDLTLDVGRLPT